VLHDEIASGGMATVHLGRLRGPVGFSRTVAIKRLHPQYAKDPEFVSMFLDEARLAARIRHPNVVPTLDVVAITGELFLVMEYVHGVSLHRMVKRARELRQRIPVDVACAIAVDALRGLHAAHEAKSERGKNLDIVHRDVSPQNVMVGVDGLSRVLDFGVAKASWRVQTTRQGQVKGKVSYMAPEQVMGGKVGRWTDLHALGIVLWEVLTGERLFPVSEERGLLARFTENVQVAPPSALNADIPAGLDAAVLQALAHDPAERQPSAQVMADQIEAAASVGTSARVGRYLQYLADEELGQRAMRIAEIEGGSAVSIITGMMSPLLDKAEPGSSSDVTEPAPSAPRAVASEDASKISMARTLVESVPVSLARRRRRAVAVAAAGALTMLLALLVVALPRGERQVEAAKSAVLPATTTPASSSGPASPSPLPAGPTEPAALANRVPEPPGEEVVDLAELPVEAADETGVRRSSKTAARRRPAAGKPATTVAACNPPYTIDARGIRHLKPECIR
jgi:eukaryotic-like serine/threonine-protein kinase